MSNDLNRGRVLDGVSRGEQGRAAVIHHDSPRPTLGVASQAHVIHDLNNVELGGGGAVAPGHQPPRPDRNGQVIFSP
jgi:hypothetical protein